MTNKYIAYYSEDDDMWFVDEIYNYNHRERGLAAIYDDMTERQAKTVAAIMNDGIDKDWDSIAADPRWQLVEVLDGSSKVGH